MSASTVLCRGTSGDPSCASGCAALQGENAHVRTRGRGGKDRICLRRGDRRVPHVLLNGNNF